MLAAAARRAHTAAARHAAVGARQASTGAAGPGTAGCWSGAWQQGRARRTHRARTVAAAASAMEVEVKLRLPGPEAHSKLQQLLAPCRVATHQQENFFFDGPARELNSRRVVLRLRFYNGDTKAVLTLKGKQVLQDGIGRASEVEEVLPDACAARAYVQQPSALLQLDSDIMRNLATVYGLCGLLCLGGFHNVRQEAAWQGFTLELDETRYEWGTLYELEAETDKPEELRAQLEALLREEGIDYSYSATSKFANFINKTLL